MVQQHNLCLQELEALDRALQAAARVTQNGTSSARPQHQALQQVNMRGKEHVMPQGATPVSTQTQSAMMNMETPWTVAQAELPAYPADITPKVLQLEGEWLLPMPCCCCSSLTTTTGLPYTAPAHCPGSCTTHRNHHMRRWRACNSQRELPLQPTHPQATSSCCQQLHPAAGALSQLPPPGKAATATAAAEVGAHHQLGHLRQCACSAACSRPTSQPVLCLQRASVSRLIAGRAGAAACQGAHCR
jgi:hypothetical protein